MVKEFIVSMDDDAFKVSKIIYSSEFERAIRKIRRQDSNTFARLENQINKVVREPNIGKPLRYTLKNRRRLHVGSFVLIYEIHNGELRFIDFDHHDKIYRKYE